MNAAAPRAGQLAPDWTEQVREQVLRVLLPAGGASAFVWSADERGSLVLTNQHVVAAEAAVTLQRSNGAELPGRVLARSPQLDLALLEVEAELPPARLGDARTLRLGELVFAWGHPWGRPWTLTHGVVSGLGEVTFGRRRAEYLRSDVRLAPGNSGGPLLSASGEVVGVNSMVWNGNLGVAVPAYVAQAWAAQLSGPRVRLGLGVSPVRLGARQALMVTELDPGGAAAQAGVHLGDVLVSLVGQAVTHPEALQRLLTRHAGGAADLEIWRAGRRVQLHVSLRAEACAA